jgi:hypothetical protein
VSPSQVRLTMQLSMRTVVGDMLEDDGLPLDEQAARATAKEGVPIADPSPRFLINLSARDSP